MMSRSVSTSPLSVGCIKGGHSVSRSESEVLERSHDGKNGLK